MYEKMLGLIVHIVYILRVEHLMPHLSDRWAPLAMLNSGQRVFVDAFPLLHDRWMTIDDGLGLHKYSAVFLWNMLPPSQHPTDFDMVIHMFGDAFRNHDTLEAGIGGYLEGYWWHLTVEPDETAALWTPHLEAAAVPANFLVFHHVLPVNENALGIAVYSDSLGTALNLRKQRAAEPVMQHINAATWALPEVQKRAAILMYRLGKAEEND